MKKAQFASPILLILLIATYFLMSSESSRIHSSLLKSRTNLVRITNDIKTIDELDLKWQANLTNEVLSYVYRVNSSGTINDYLVPLNASIYEYNEFLLVNYTKTYDYEGISKTINGTIIVPYPYFEFVEIENQIRACYNTNSLEYCVVGIDIEPISAELQGTTVAISNNDYVLTRKELYPYIILFE
ncbi:MAG: hypothetical protein WC393_02910 [Candidatus Nanoarchaeia archaeon]